MQERITEQVQVIFRRVFNNPNIVISTETKADDIKDWDSLTHLELISELETHFKFLFSFEEVMSFENVGQMIDCIAKKLNQGN